MNVISRNDLHDPAPVGALPAADTLDLLYQDNDTINLPAVRAMIWRNRWMIAQILLAGLVLGILSLLILPRIYTARASIQIDQQTRKVLGNEDADPVSSDIDAERFLQTQIDVLQSRAMARRVSDTLGLAANDQFLTRMGGTAPTILSPADRQDKVVDALQHNLAIDLPRNTRVVGILFSSRDAQLSADVANTYVHDAIEANVQRKFAASSYSMQFLRRQLDMAKGRVENSERALIAYSRQAGLIDASAGASTIAGSSGPRSLVTADLVGLNQRAEEARANRLQAEERWLQANATPLMSLPEVLSNDAIQRLLQRRVELSSNLSQLRSHLKPDHPTVVQAVAELGELDREARQLASTIKGGIDNQYLVAQRQQNAIDAAVVSLKTATLAEQDRSVEYNILKREADTNRQLYDSLLQRFKEVSAQSGVINNNISPIDVAEAPRKPSSPRPLVNLGLALGLALALSMLAIRFRERAADSIRNPRDVERKLGLPLLGVVPLTTDIHPVPALLNAKSDISEAFHTVRSAIELSSSTGIPSSILVTSTQPAEGKSTTCYALARDFARLGRRVLLIDADLRRPSMHSLFDVENAGSGLSSVLAGLVPAKDAIVIPSEFPHLAFMPCGPLPPDPASLVSGSRLPQLLEAMKQDYDIVMLDGPPMLALADSPVIAGAAAAVVLVVEAGKVNASDARNSAARLKNGGARLLGAVLSKYDRKDMSYNYRYDYGS